MEHTGPARKWNRLMKGKQYNYGTLITIWKSCYYFVCTVYYSIIAWWFSYWPSYRFEACCIGLRHSRRPIHQTEDLINFDLLAFIWSNMSIQYKNFHWANTAKTSPIRILPQCVNNIVLLRDVFHIGLVIGPRPAVLVWGAAERQYSKPRTKFHS
jgi:hypothetical protein